MVDSPSAHAPDDEPGGQVLDEAGRRRKRTNTYLAMWAIAADVSAVPIATSGPVAIKSADQLVGRSKAYCLTSLKGQGLSQHEVFAFADAYEVWNHLDDRENDYVLDPDPPREADVNFAWRYEALWAAEFVLGFVRHLGYPDHPSDPAKAVQLCISEICAPSGRTFELRPLKDILDAADVSRCLDAVSRSVAASGEVPPSGLQPGVVAERVDFFAWLLA